MLQLSDRWLLGSPTEHLGADRLWLVPYLRKSPWVSSHQQFESADFVIEGVQIRTGNREVNFNLGACWRIALGKRRG